MNRIVTCASLAEVRAQIDRLDRQIVGLLAERGGYVRQAARFKRNADEVQAPQRVAQVLAKVKGLAQGQDADPQVVEAVYRAMIAAFTRPSWPSRHGSTTEPLFDNQVRRVSCAHQMPAASGAHYSIIGKS